MTPLISFILLASVIATCTITSIYAPLFAHYRTQPTRLHLYGISATILLGALALYTHLGAWQQINTLDEAHEALQSARFSLPELAKAVESTPKSLDNRIAYASALGKLGQHDKAAEQFKVAVLLSGGRPDLILDFATAQILSADGMVSDDAIKSVEMVLLIAPNEPKARYFKAMYLLQHEKKVEAIALLEKIMHDLPNTDPLFASVSQRLNSLRTAK